jgi:branched-chain amino acid aminotransferase
MPCFIRVLTPDGLRPVDYQADSLAEAAVHEPDDGIYTVTNTYDTYRVLKLNAHFDRMEDSARGAGIPLRLDRARLRAALRQMIDEAGFGDVRFRVTVPRDRPDHYILTLEPFSPLSPTLIAEGARCITVPDAARDNPAVKSTSWMHQRQDIADKLPPGVYDAILLNAAGELMEGLSSNFYAILDGQLRTAAEGVLPGIAQKIVFEVAPPILPVRREAVHVSELPRVQEAFITSSSRGIVPMVEIDGQRLGDGRPGPLTMAIRQAYIARAAAYLEEL